MQLRREGEPSRKAGDGPAAARVRPAAPDDAGALAALAARLFRATYGPAADPALGGGSRDADVDAYVRAHFTPAAQAAELADPAVATMVAEAAGGVPAGGGASASALIGYAQLRAPSPHPAVGAGAAELARLYVDARWHGRGVADALLAAAVDAARAAGAPAVWLAVYRRNARAVAFYRRRGFREAGTGTFRLGAEVQDDWIMTREC